MKKVLLSFVFLCLLLLGGCSKVEKECQTIFSKALPTGLFYNGLIYWQTKTALQVSDGKSIGKVVADLECDDFPQNQFEISMAGNTYKDAEIFKDGNILYVKQKDTVVTFTYQNEMALGEEKEITEKGEDTNYPPHFIYQNMRFTLCDQYQSVFAEKEFQKVGLIKENDKVAVKNFSGNIIMNAELYAMDTQNRFMLVKYPQGGLEVYCNEAYY